MRPKWIDAKILFGRELERIASDQTRSRTP